MNYTTEKYTAKIDTSEYVKKYVDADKFTAYCRACSNYERKWSCPSYAFDTYEYWAAYKNLKITGLKIIFDKKLTENVTERKRIVRIVRESLYTERRKLDAEMLIEEKELKGKALYAGSCNLCGSVPCKRVVKEACRYPEKMRYSLESLGADVSASAEELLGIKLKWAKKNEFAEYLTLVCGVLYN